MLLRNTHWYSEGQEGSGDIRINQGHITEMGGRLAPRARERVIDLRDHLVLPGLINAHDHLEWNLLQMSGRTPYANFSAYAEDIHHPEKSPIRELLRISFRDRLSWGGYKNLISGVTTVCHHNPFDPFLARTFPVRVVENIAWSHSLNFAVDIVSDFEQSRGRPFVVHAAEGVDETARSEVAALDHLGILGEKTVLVHGVALQDAEIDLMAERGVALIWCPVSNLRLFGATAPIDRLTGRVPLALGSDATLTGGVSLFEELRTASATGYATSEDLFKMVTTGAAQVLNLPQGYGTLQSGGPGDLLVLPDQSLSPCEVLLRSDPGDVRLVIRDGDIWLAAQPMEGFPGNIFVDGYLKHVGGDFSKLKKRIAKHLGSVAELSPLWPRLLDAQDCASQIPDFKEAILR